VRVIPALDLKAGVVVRGVAGEREKYRPIVSPLVSSSTPREVASTLQNLFGLQEFYIADLDAIGGAPPALSIYADIQSLGVNLWVDAGIRVTQQIAPLLDAGIATIVAGLETLAGPDVLSEITRSAGAERIVFSLDLRKQKPLAAFSAWRERDPLFIAGEVFALGVRRLLVLDLASVGIGGGTGTDELCRTLARNHPALEISAGGGVRDVNDLRRLRDSGVQNVLVASALHDGRIKPSDLVEFGGRLSASQRQPTAKASDHER
jgi:phosphoribosylformimino-5-aminoimidazole carboxamide ribotide isomerase